MKKLIFTTSLLLLPFISSQAWSACADTGAVSSIINTDGCTSVINLAIPQLVTVKNLGDIDLGTYTSGSDESGNDDFCIGTNSAAGVTVTFTSENGNAGQFNLAGTTVTTDLIPYNLQFTDAANFTTATVTSGAIISTTGVETLACGADASNIQVDVLATDIDAAGDVAYQDTITITVSPN